MAASTTEEQWDRLVAAHKVALAYWHQTNLVLEDLPPSAEFDSQAGRDHDRAIVELDASEDAILEASPPNGAGVTYQFKVAAERYMEVEVEENPSRHEEPVRAAICRRVYATLLAVK